jgi:putative membrane protein
MSEESSGSGKNTQLAEQRTELAGDRTRWAADRTLWAADRTFIAWLRTAISMIGFGIGIGKAGDALETQGILLDQFHGLQITGLGFVALGVLGLLGALVQDIRIGKRLADQGYGRVEPVPLGQAMGYLVLAVGILGAIFIFL